MKQRLVKLLLTGFCLTLNAMAFASEFNDESTGYVERFPIVKIETTMGNILVELDRGRAPITVDNFLGYVKRGQYDNSLIHRVDVNYVIQAGGYKQNFEAIKTQEPIYNESGNGLKNLAGTIAMAREHEPHTATNQFYFNLDDNSNLDPGRHWGYTVFGSVIEGMNVLETISDVETEYNEKLDYSNFPKKLIIIKKVTLVKKAE